jgi:septation ring formation regulator EzrA
MRFKKTSENIIQQEKSLKKEFNFYRENLKQVLSSYQNKRVMLENIAIKLSQLISSIKQIEEDFVELINKAEIKLASDLVNKYKDKILALAKVINEGPQLQIFIYKSIPDNVRKLIQQKKEYTTNKKIDIDYICFEESIRKIGAQYILAKNLYLELSISKSEEKVINILKNLKLLERMINTEIKSRNIFMKNYETTLNLVKISLKNYVKIKSNLKNINKEVKIMDFNLNDKYQELQSLSKTIDELAISYREIFNNKRLPFSAKLSRTKILANKCLNIIDVINEIYTIL